MKLDCYFWSRFKYSWQTSYLQDTLRNDFLKKRKVSGTNAIIQFIRQGDNFFAYSVYYVVFKYWNQGEAKLIWTSPHSFTFLIQEPLHDAEGKVLRATQNVCTASIRIINIGRETATEVELVFNWKPHHVNLWPVRHFEQKTDQDHRHIMIFDNLTPREEIGLEILSTNADLPALLLVRSAECTAQNVPLMWVRHTASWKITLSRFFIFFGMAATVYGVIALVQFLVLKTPYGL